MELIKSIISDKLSTYRSEHEFQHYAEIASIQDVCRLQAWALEKKIRTYVLGNGSNVLFKRRKVKSLIMRNRFPTAIQPLGEDRFRVSSSTSIAKLLKFMHQAGRDCCYYLASVPATVGGAVAMNAGRGRSYGISILDFVEEVQFVEAGELKTLHKSRIPHKYRNTLFTGRTDRVITSVIMTCPLKTMETNPIADRVLFSKQTQDHSLPNCGSVFKKYNVRIMTLLSKACFSLFGAKWSHKTINWIVNSSDSSFGVHVQISVAKTLHVLLGKRAVLEVIVIE
jgi:UDP-N-acetylmuramate dehydrogenase